MEFKKLALYGQPLHSKSEMKLETNTIVITGENGSGKTTFLTTVFPNILTMDLRSSIKITDRKSKESVSEFKEHPTWVVAEVQGIKENPEYEGFVFEEDLGKTITLAICYWGGNTINHYGCIFNGGGMKFVDSENRSLSMKEIESRYGKPSFKSSSPDDYQLEIVKRIYKNPKIDLETARKLFKIYLKSFQELSRPQNHFKDGDTKTFIPKLQATFKETLPSIFESKNRIDMVKNYAEESIEKKELQFQIENIKKKKELLEESDHFTQSSLNIAFDALKEAYSNIESRLTQQQQKQEENEEKITETNKKILELSKDIDQLEIDLNKLRDEERELERQIQNDQVEQERKNQENLLQIEKTNFERNNKTLESNRGRLREKNNTKQSVEEKINALKIEEQSHLEEACVILSKTMLSIEDVTIQEIDEQLKQLELLSKLKDELTRQEEHKSSIQKELDSENKLFNERKKRLRQHQLLLEQAATTASTHYNFELPTTGIDDFLNWFKIVQGCVESCQTGLMLKEFEWKTEIKQLKSQLSDIKESITTLENAKKPEIHYKGEGIPFFEQMEFKDHIADDTQKMIESLLKKADVLEFLLNPNNVTKGVIYNA